MIQRKQTLFLIIAIVLNIVCLCLPIGRLVFQGMGADAIMTNLWIQMADGTRDFSVWHLFVVLLLSCPITIWAISATRTAVGRWCSAISVCCLWCYGMVHIVS